MIIKNNQRDLGIELLRVVLCFWIVLVHCLSKSKLLNIVGRNDYHVPCFIVISFYFFYNALCKKNISKIRIRFIRLLIPFWIWPIIIWLFNNIFKYYYSSNRFNRFLSFNDLEIQLLVGRKFHRQFWFLFNLLIFNLFFLIISFLLKNNFLFLLQLLGIIVYILQYSGISQNFFSKYYDCIQYSIGHCISTFPIAVISLSFSSTKAIPKFKYHSLKTIFFSNMIIFIVLRYNVFIDMYAYYGFKKALISFLMFISFASLTIEKLNSMILKSIINRITQYTQGIFCLHNIIRFYFMKILKLKRIYIKECIIIYLISYLICFIGTQFCYKSNFKYLFN